MAKISVGPVGSVLIAGGLLLAGAVVLPIRGAYLAYKAVRRKVDREYMIRDNVREAWGFCTDTAMEAEMLRHSPRMIEHFATDRYRKTLREAIAFYEHRGDLEEANRFTGMLNEVVQRR